MRALALLLVLAACAELPPVEGAISEAARREPYPVLVPLGTLLAEAERPSRAAPAAAELEARGARLRAARVPAPGLDALRAEGRRLRARTVPAPAEADLDARGRRLRERAEALRAVPV
ncbi:hypothetical protein [Jannaschia sp. W003]|uniref:hypothetical protein n=1 Tax=Jannaschia sp. W003 TaxID=2867012 RepID=UPI0021A5EF4D|nr:hypothetical protein [Jannaschia sp. W003]UWQ21034.1 hypothetical protein K3554_13815 [Jannaschia sp. W003]